MDKKKIFSWSLKKNAKNDVEKSLFKLMNNSAYGKIMGNLRKKINVRLVNKTLKYVRNKLLFLKKVLLKGLLLFMKLNLS